MPPPRTEPAPETADAAGGSGAGSKAPSEASSATAGGRPASVAGSAAPSVADSQPTNRRQRRAEKSARNWSKFGYETTDDPEVVECSKALAVELRLGKREQAELWGRDKVDLRRMVANLVKFSSTQLNDNEPLEVCIFTTWTMQRVEREGISGTLLQAATMLVAEKFMPDMPDGTLVD